jgi:hypothetical protein
MGILIKIKEAWQHACNLQGGLELVANTIEMSTLEYLENTPIHLNDIDEGP